MESNSDLNLAKLCLQTSSKWIKKFHGQLCLWKYYDQRIRLQKLEFCIVWMLAISTAIAGFFEENSILETFALMPTVCFMRLSFFTRLITYAIDIDKARVKFGTVPIWMLWHHSGVIIVHFATVLVPLQQYSFNFAFFGLIGTQTSMNTWLKKESTLLYKTSEYVGLASHFTWSALTLNMHYISIFVRFGFVVAALFVLVGICLNPILIGIRANGSTRSKDQKQNVMKDHEKVREKQNVDSTIRDTRNFKDRQE